MVESLYLQKTIIDVYSYLSTFYFIFWVHSFRMIQNRISDPSDLGTPCIEGAGESLLRVDSPSPLMYSDLCDLGSLIQLLIFPKERTLYVILR